MATIHYPEHKFKLQITDLYFRNQDDGKTWTISKTHFNIKLLRLSYSQFSNQPPEAYKSQWQLFHFMLGISIPKFKSRNINNPEYYKLLLAFNAVGSNLEISSGTIPIKSKQCDGEGTEYCLACDCKCNEPYCYCLSSCNKCANKKNCLGNEDYNEIPTDVATLCQKYNSIVSAKKSIGIIDIINEPSIKNEMGDVKVFLVIYPYLRFFYYDNKFKQENIDDYLDELITLGIIDNKSKYEDIVEAHNLHGKTVTNDKTFIPYLQVLIDSAKTAV